jgi:hypothetical protein
MLAAAEFRVIGVARSRSPESVPADADWVYADLRSSADRRRVASVVTASTWGQSSVFVIDVVLDRSGVEAMRQSLRGALDTVFLVSDQLVSSGTVGKLISASTTAILAPWLYQTPYGIAKRRQVVTYARSGMTGLALLLPLLADQRPLAATGGWPVWSFEHAARRLADEALLAVTSPPGFGIRVPVLATDSSATRRRSVTGHSPADGVLLSHLHSLVTHRDSMQAHRAAARARLLLTPRFIRQQFDHHQVRAMLLRRFADRYHVTIDAEPAATVDVR